jgi:hypothetical protein
MQKLKLFFPISKKRIQCCRPLYGGAGTSANNYLEGGGGDALNHPIASDLWRHGVSSFFYEHAWLKLLSILIEEWRHAARVLLKEKEKTTARSCASAEERSSRWTTTTSRRLMAVGGGWSYTAIAMLLGAGRERFRCATSVPSRSLSQIPTRYFSSKSIGHRCPMVLVPIDPASFVGT